MSPAPIALLTLFLATLSPALAHSHEPVERSSGFAKRQSAYPPQDVPGPTPKAEWVATYNTAKAAGKIPSWPVATIVNGSNPAYPPGTVLGAGGVCSWTSAHCFGTYDVVDAPTGVWGISFDDGPQLASPPLYDFLKANNQHGTHFYIGSRVVDNPTVFAQALANGEHLAVHTWSHHYMTTLTDMQILGELGWTAQIIYDHSGGLVPAFWRPPYGDIDNRVRAIAEQVFGLYSVVWNQDTDDWCLGENNVNFCPGAGPGTDAGLDAELQKFMNGPKSPGLIILEHELTSRTVGGFERAYPQLAGKGWQTKAIPDIWSVNWYLNAARTTGGPIDTTMQIGSGANPFVTGGNSAAANMSSSASLIPSLTSIASAANTSTVAIATPTSLGVNVTASLQAAPTSAPNATAASAVKSSSPSTSQKASSGVREVTVSSLAGIVVLGLALVV